MLTLHRSERPEPDRGFAMVIALLVTAIAYLIMTAVLAQAIHNVVLAGHGRRRMAAINASEGGLNWYSNLLSTSNLMAAMDNGLGWSQPSSGCPVSLSSCWYVLGPTTPSATKRVTVADKPELATFELRVLLLSKNPCTTAAGAATRCSLSNVPAQLTVWDSSGAITGQGVLMAKDTPSQPWPDMAYMVVRSTGVVGTVRRTLESYVRLRATRTGVPGGFVAEAVCLGNAAKLIINGDFSVANQAAASTTATSTAFDTDCKTGNIEVASGDSLELRAFNSAGGTLAVRGGGLTVNATSPLMVQNDIWAAGAVKLGAGSAATSCPTGSGVQCVQGDAIGSSVLVGSNAYVAGNVITCSPACPPSLAFPQMTWNQADWQDPWTVVDLTTTSGLLDVMESKTSPTVFHISGNLPGSCDLPFTKANASGGEVLLTTKIAVVSECRFTFNGASADILADGPDAALFLISAWPSSGPPSCGSPTRSSIGVHDIEINQNPTIETGFFVYTPCFLWLGNNQNPLSGGDFIQGQFAGRFLIVDQQVTLSQVNIADFVSTLPGQLTGFKQDVRFVREILTTIAANNDIL